MDLSCNDLFTFGAACLWVGLGLLVTSAVLWQLRRKRVAALLLAVAVICGASGIIGVTDCFCLAGYTADDGSCAWE